MFGVTTFLLVTTLVVPPAGVSVPAPQQTATRAAAPARLTVTLPAEDSELTVDEKPIAGAGVSRQVEVPLAQRGAAQRVTIMATWKPNSYTTMTRSRTLTVKPGERVAVNLSVEDASDRVRVIYVPTPPDVSDAMVRLGRVTAKDVVFEPGCGDARITIAAVKHGARKGVGIDIDAERVEESRIRVKEAGLADKIEIRLGDALDIKDLSTADVVMLYMGDHFNLLIRPSLWRELKVGARVVSHRFLMGDWKPDETLTMTSEEGGEYELHVWTITEEVKRRVKK